MFLFEFISFYVELPLYSKHYANYVETKNTAILSKFYINFDKNSGS